MKQREFKANYIVKCKGTPILGSVCSFAHDHAILKMVEFLGQLDNVNINNISCGDAEKMPVEYCEAEIEFAFSDEGIKEKIPGILDEMIAKTGYQGITYERITDDSAMNQVV